MVMGLLKFLWRMLVQLIITVIAILILAGGLTAYIKANYTPEDLVKLVTPYLNILWYIIPQTSERGYGRA